MHGSPTALKQIQEAAKLHLFLDYDGTLAEFAPTPDEIYPDPELIALLERLNKQMRIQVAVISGRRLSHIRDLVPVPGILLAGTYGIELVDALGDHIERVDFAAIRPTLDKLKTKWIELVRPHPKFYLEDKGWSLALHAKDVDTETVFETLSQARQVIDKLAVSSDLFRVLGGHKFLEVAPRLANKGLTIHYLCSSYPLAGALPLYIGDDDKDEEAFAVINQLKGISIVVSESERETLASLRLNNPASVRNWLRNLIMNELA
jgi:trehalose 6-phosphate phosphatase